MKKLRGKWLANPDTQQVCRMMVDAGYECFFVGGCVRNALLGAPVNDIDLSTNARPETVMDIAARHGLKAIPTGIDHGTVTVISGGTPHEITTYRKDIETDGRHAKISFAQNIKDDAQRRDFTMNAIYCDIHGTILDPLNGLPDLEAGRVKFILNPTKRIREDYLRILRFFRFHAWYGNPANGIDAAGLAACAENIEGLSKLSKERVGSEILKLLAAPDPSPSVSSMEKIGALGQILPGASAKALPILVHFEKEMHIKPDPLRRLAAFGAFAHNSDLRLSKKQSAKLSELLNGVNSDDSPAVSGFLHGENQAIDIVLLRAALLETPPPPEVITQIQAGAKKVFPIQARDLMPDYSGGALGKALSYLQEKWILSEMRASKSELLKSIDKNVD